MNLHNLISKEKDLKMVWKIERNGKRSYLAGTVHFFPYSFKKSLARYISSVDIVLLEGPLDVGTMRRVVDYSLLEKGEVSDLYGALEKETIIQINRELARPRRGLSSFPSYADIFKPKAGDFLYSLAALKPWMAFFTIWFQYLEKRGWRYMMDVDAFKIAQQLGKDIHFLEKIEEQLEALDGIPLERIVYFLKKIRHWSTYARAYVKCYLKGDLEDLMSIAEDFPSRCESVIDKRDRILYERMRGFFEKGNAIALIGSPHIREIKRMFLEDGYKLA